MSKIRLDIGENKENIPKLEHIRIKDKEMIPEYTINVTKATETLTDENKNVMGFQTSIVKSHTITLRPQEFYKNGSGIENDSKEKG